jgi:hypothetical protein
MIIGHEAEAPDVPSESDEKFLGEPQAKLRLQERVQNIGCCS